jgi:hypothetical protein
MDQKTEMDARAKELGHACKNTGIGLEMYEVA